MVKHNKNFKSKKKQSLKKKALRKTKRKGGKKSIKNIGGFGAFTYRAMCEPRIARFNVTENYNRKDKEWKEKWPQTTSVIHGYISSGNFKQLLHEFYYEQWKIAVDGDNLNSEYKSSDITSARSFFGKPRTGSKIPTIQFVFDTSEVCGVNEKTVKTDAKGFYHINPDSRTTRPMFIKFKKFDDDDGFKFSTHIDNIKKQQESITIQKETFQRRKEKKKEEEEYSNFIDLLYHIGFREIKKEKILELECDIRLPSITENDRRVFAKSITEKLQESDSNFLENDWYVFYYHNWNNDSSESQIYFQYGVPVTKIKGHNFIDLLSNIHNTPNLVVQNFRLTREMGGGFGFTDSCKK